MMRFRFEYVLNKLEIVLFQSCLNSSDVSTVILTHTDLIVTA